MKKNFSAGTIALVGLVGLQLVFLLAPVGALVRKSIQSPAGDWTLTPFLEFLCSPGIGEAAFNTAWVAMCVVLLTVPTAFLYAYAILRTAIPLKGLWRILGLAALLGPSLVGAVAFIQWFGNQGVFKPLMGNLSIYGPLGIILGTSFAAFPHALLILLVALASADGRLYEAARAMGASSWKVFTTITLPSARYGLVSACMVVFAYSVSEFGVPKVIGGNFKVLAVEIYIQAVGLQNFARGGMVALMLLLPVVLASAVEVFLRHTNRTALGARATPLQILPSLGRDAFFFAYVFSLATVFLGMLAMTVYSAVIKFWPYNLNLTWDHFRYGLTDAGVGHAFANSLQLALATALIGTPLAFLGAYLAEKTAAGSNVLGAVYRFMALLPMGVPGLALGLGAILVFNQADSPLSVMYRTMGLLVAITVVHFFAASHVSATSALRALDREFEAISASLKVPQWKTFWRVTLPVCLPAVLDIFRYLFINAMTTVSAVVFLYAPETLPATVAIINLDEAGELGPAAAMATLIMLANLVFSAAHAALGHLLLRRHHAWRTR
ncbi:putative 2-aminoethylphosphonate ABC transporter permease subunit [Curvibacter sp. APW13]|uniref:putative 2-aminoethylphosphonate ABC transporter permease subunit n=1 Tax=Curvibacter sp. APW13 TaxID=3077236 RepID=UPI0028E01883|nr:putative 2-aminoethylphosphonate ABC transporter permease subunit [Curvibacter sp. APW13]MDT8989896.1 putative 2-aminoethylphosphonate ABC transporter permease subunit [Curvibacter sp. APW13]